MRERQMLKLAVALVLMCGSAAAYVVGYHVEPVKASWSGQTRTIWGQDFVSQGVTCNFDSLSYVELFAGEKDSGGQYTVTVLDDGVPLMSSNGTQYLDCSWVRFEGGKRDTSPIYSTSIIASKEYQSGTCC